MKKVIGNISNAVAILLLSIFVGDLKAQHIIEGVHQDEPIQVQTEMLKISVTPVPTKDQVVWTLTRNGNKTQEFYHEVGDSKVDLTIIIEDVLYKGGQQRYFVSENLSKLVKHYRVNTTQVKVVGNRAPAFRIPKTLDEQYVDSFEEAIAEFWNQRTVNKKALLIVSNKTDALPSNLLDRLRNEDGLATALVYYLALRPVKKGSRSYASWSNLSWLNLYAVTENEQYVDKQFEAFRDMLNSYQTFEVDVNDEQNLTVNVTATEKRSGKVLVNQTRVYRRK